MDIDVHEDEESSESVDLSDHEGESDPAEPLDEDDDQQEVEGPPQGVGDTAQAFWGDGDRDAEWQANQAALSVAMQEAIDSGVLLEDEALAARGFIEVLANVRGVDVLRGLPNSDFTALKNLGDCPDARLVQHLDFDTCVYLVNSLAHLTHCHPRPPSGRGEGLDLQRLKVQLVLRGGGIVIGDLRQRAPLCRGRRARNHRAAAEARAGLDENPRHADEVVAVIPMYRAAYLAYHPTIDSAIHMVDVALAFAPAAPAVWTAWNLYKELHRVALQGFPEEGQPVLGGVRLTALLASHATAHPEDGKQFGPNDVKWGSATSQMGPSQMKMWAARLRNADFRVVFLQARRGRFREAWTGTEAEFEERWAQVVVHFEALAAPGGVRYLMTRQLHRQRTGDVVYDTFDELTRATVAHSTAETVTSELLTGIDLSAVLPPGWRQIQAFPTVGMEVDVVRGSTPEAEPYTRQGASWTTSRESRYVPVLDRGKVRAAAAHPAVVAAADGRFRCLPSMGNMSSTAGPCGVMCAAGIPTEPNVELDDVGLARLVAGTTDAAGAPQRAAMLMYHPMMRRTMHPLHMLWDEVKASKLALDAVEGPPQAVEALGAHLVALRQEMAQSVANMGLHGAVRIERVTVITLESHPLEATTDPVLLAVLALVEALAGLRVERLVGLMDGGAFRAYLGAYIDAITGVAQHCLKRSGGAPQAVVLALAAQGIIMFIMEAFSPGRQLPWLANRMMKLVFVVAARRGFPFLDHQLLSGLAGMELYSERQLDTGLVRMFDMECRAEIIAHFDRRLMGARGYGTARSPAARLELFRGAMTAVINRVHPRRWSGLWATFKGAMLLLTLYHSSLEVHGTAVIRREVRGRFRMAAGVIISRFKAVRADGTLLARFDNDGQRLQLADLLGGYNAERLHDLLVLGGATEAVAFAGDELTPLNAAATTVDNARARLCKAAAATRRSYERSPYLACVAGMVGALEDMVFPYEEDGTFRALGAREWALDVLGRLDTLSVYAALGGRSIGGVATPLFTAESWKQKRVDVGKVVPGLADTKVEVENDIRTRLRRAQVARGADTGQADPMQPRGLASGTSARAVEMWEAAIATLVETAVKRGGRSALAGADATFKLRDVPCRRDNRGRLREVIDHDAGDNDYSNPEESEQSEFESSSGDDIDAGEGQEGEEEAGDGMDAPHSPTPPLSSSSSSEDGEGTQAAAEELLCLQAAAALHAANETETLAAPPAQRSERARGRGRGRGGGRRGGRGAQRTRTEAIANRGRLRRSKRR